MTYSRPELIRADAHERPHFPDGIPADADAARPPDPERHVLVFGRSLLVVALFALGLMACGEPIDDTTGTVPVDPDIERVEPLEPSERVEPVEPGVPLEPVTPTD